MDKIQNVFGKNLIVVASYTLGDEQKALFVVEKLRFEDLMQLKLKIKKGLPLILSKEELEDGADVFPLEFLNIKKTHKVLHGDRNIIKNLKIEKRHVRRQLEFEFRSKLIHLREEYISAESFKPLLKNAIPVLSPIIHGLLYLKNNEERCRNFEEYLQLLKLDYTADFTVLEKIRKNQDLESEDTVQQLMILLNTLCDAVDEYKG